MAVLFSDHGVTIDTDFARFGSKSYAVDKITSTDVKALRPYGCLSVIGVVIALFCFFLSLGGFQAGIIIGGLALAGSIAAMMIRSYALVIVSSAQEVNAFQSSDEAVILNMKEAVEAAMTHKSAKR